MKKFYQILFISFFMFFITTPSIKHMLTKDKLISSENRKLAQRPSKPSSITEIRPFISRLDSYLTDQFGFRRNFISAANKIKFNVFNEVLSKQITIGKNGYFYFNSHTSKSPNSLIKSVCDISVLPQSFQNKIEKNFIEYVNYFRQKGIQTHIAVIPTKSRIYPENLPDVESSWCKKSGPTWRDQLFSKLSSKTVYYPLNLMLQLKKSMPVYFSKYFHWHGELPKKIALDIMKNLWNIDPIFNIQPENLRIKSDLKLHLKGLSFYENSVVYDYKKYGVNYCNGIQCTINIEKYYKRALVRTFKKNHNNFKLVLISDSFGKNIATNFIEGFSEVVHIDSNNIRAEEYWGLYQWIIDEVQPTHMLFLMHDGGLFGQTKMIEQFLLDASNKIQH